MFRIKVVEKIETHILCSVTFFFVSENRAVYEIMWKNIVELDRPQMTIWRMRLACWIPNSTNINSEYVIIIDFSTGTVAARTRLDVTLYMHCVSCLYILWDSLNVVLNHYECCSYIRQHT